MPFNLSFTHILVVGIVALVVLGPERLPGVARTAGNLYREWKRISGGLEAEVREAIADFTEPLQEPISQIRDTVRGVSDAPATSVAPATGAPAAIDLPPLTPAIPALGPSTGLVSPGPVMERAMPELGPLVDPDTFVPYAPGQGAPS